LEHVFCGFCVFWVILGSPGKNNQNMDYLVKWLCQQDAHQNYVQKDVLYRPRCFSKVWLLKEFQEFVNLGLNVNLNDMKGQVWKLVRFCVVFYTLWGDQVKNSCTGVPACSLCIVFYTLWSNVSITTFAVQDCPRWAFVLRFTRFEVLSVQQTWLRGSARMKLLHRVLHASRWYQCNKDGCSWVPTWSFLHCVLYTRFEAIWVHQSWLRGSARMKFFYRVLHPCSRYQYNKVGCAGVPSVPKLVARGCPCDTFVVFCTLLGHRCNNICWGDVSVTEYFVRSARFELLYSVLHAFRRCQCNKLDWCASARMELLCCILLTLRQYQCKRWLHGSARMKLLHFVLHTSRRYQCNKVDCVGVHALGFCIVFYTLWGDIRVANICILASWPKVDLRTLGDSLTRLGLEGFLLSNLKGSGLWLPAEVPPVSGHSFPRASRAWFPQPEVLVLKFPS